MLKLIEYGLIWLACSFAVGIPIGIMLDRAGKYPQRENENRTPLGAA